MKNSVKSLTVNAQHYMKNSVKSLMRLDCGVCSEHSSSVFAWFLQKNNPGICILFSLLVVQLLPQLAALSSVLCVHSKVHSLKKKIMQKCKHKEYTYIKITSNIDIENSILTLKTFKISQPN